jgi:aerotaxis receptor
MIRPAQRQGDSRHAHNQPVTQRSSASRWPAVSTDPQGRITHCNAAFVAISGCTYEELLGEPHNIVRHPDMPPEAFKDMWQPSATGGPGRGRQPSQGR